MKTLKLRRYQENAINFACANDASFMMLDVGLGKTAIALKTIQRINKIAIVFAPLRVATIVWPEEIKKWTPELTYTILHGSKKNRRFLYERDIYLIPYSSLKWYFNKIMDTYKNLKYCCLILDESSMVKNPSTQRFKMLQKLSLITSPHKINLSATPSPNGLHELWSQVNILDNGYRLGNSYVKFRDEYFDYIGPPVFKTTIKPFHDKLIHEKIEDISYRLAAEDYLEMPEITYNKISIEMPHNLRKGYEKLEKDFYVKIGKDTISTFSASANSIKLRQYLQGAVYTLNPKYKVIHNMKVMVLKELVESNAGQPMLCVIQFKFELDMIQNELGRIPIISGGTSAKESAILIKKWNEGRLPLLLCHPASISHGMNLQAGGHIILWYGLTWSLEQYHQLNGRLHRQGQRKAVIVNNLVFKNTIDEVILKILANKNNTQRQLLYALKVSSYG